MDSGQQGRQYTRCGCAAHLTLTARVGAILQSAFTCVLSHLITLALNDLHSTMSCVLSEELAPTPLEAVQVMVAKALSFITLVTLRVLVTLSSDMETSVEQVMTRVTPSSLESTPSLSQEMVGAGTPVAVHISAPEAPSEMVTVGFWEAKIAASGATEQRRQDKYEPMTNAWQGGAGLTHPTLVAQWSCCLTLHHSLLNRCKCQCPLQWC